MGRFTRRGNKSARRCVSWLLCHAWMIAIENSFGMLVWFSCKTLLAALDKCEPFFWRPSLAPKPMVCYCCPNKARHTTTRATTACFKNPNCSAKFTTYFFLCHDITFRAKSQLTVGVSRFMRATHLLIVFHRRANFAEPSISRLHAVLAGFLTLIASLSKESFLFEVSHERQ